MRKIRNTLRAMGQCQPDLRLDLVRGRRPRIAARELRRLNEGPNRLAATPKAKVIDAIRHISQRQSIVHGVDVEAQNAGKILW